MTRNTSRRRGWRKLLITPVLRPALWSALLGAVVSAVLATPVYAETPLLRADPLPNTVPDTGVRPAPNGDFVLPGATTPPRTVPPPSTVTGPLATRISNLEVEVATLGEQLLTLRQEKFDALTAVANTQRELGAAREALRRAEEAAKIAATKALKEAAALPPGAFGSDLHDIGLLSRLERGQRDSSESTATAREMARAEAAERAANQAAIAASAQAEAATKKFDTAKKTYEQRVAELLKLKKENTRLLIELEREREAAEQRLGDEIGSGTADGLVAHPRALAAMRYALAQLGDPYQWAAEGPNRFDCSGLIWAAYRAKGADYFKLPRVSRDQYRATRHNEVSRTALLPGDLLFFASGSTPSSIHHVGMYIGGGKMVHAPTTGDVVKISTVRWSRFYAATRVFDGIPASKPPANDKPKPPTDDKPKPPADDKPTPSPSPDPDPASPSPEPEPTTPSPEPTSPSPEPTTASPSPSPAPTPSPSPKPEPTLASPSPKPEEDTPSAGPSGSPGASTSASSAPSASPVP